MEQKRSLMIKGLMPGLVERGKIKIGMKGESRPTKDGGKYQLPVKLDHFLITSMNRNKDSNNFERDEQIHAALGPDPIKSIPVRLLFDDIELNFQSRYVCYRGTTMMCFGDGECGRELCDNKGNRKEVPCPCNKQEMNYTGPDKCKINGTLSVMIEAAAVVGGVWKFRTTSYNSVVGILSSLTLIKRITGGALAGVPLNMTLNPKTVQNPLDGKNQTVYVVGLEFRGSVLQLQQEGHKIALENQKHMLQIQHIETEAKLLLAKNTGEEYGLDAEDVVAEWYPEQAPGFTPEIPPMSAPEGLYAQAVDADGDPINPEPNVAKELSELVTPPAPTEPSAKAPVTPAAPVAPVQTGKRGRPAVTQSAAPAATDKPRRPFKTTAEMEAEKASRAAEAEPPTLEQPEAPPSAPVQPPAPAPVQSTAPAPAPVHKAPPVGESVDLF